MPDVRPGFTCTAEITTATRTNVVAVPIQALTVREMLFDPTGQAGARAAAAAAEPVRARADRARPAPAEPPPGHTRKETEGVFLLQDGRAVFTPVKIGVAGEQYFEVLSGLKAGDQVITGPFASVRELADGESVRLQANAVAAGTARRRSRPATHRSRMNQILESVCIALQAIWANKLRSFMTVLGNIVAVTSIVTVVSLIQGMNAMVSTAIVSDVGADSFTIQRLPPIRSEDDEERTRNNPLLTLRRGRRDPRLQPAHRRR